MKIEFESYLENEGTGLCQLMISNETWATQTYTGVKSGLPQEQEEQQRLSPSCEEYDGGASSRISRGTQTNTTFCNSLMLQDEREEEEVPLEDLVLNVSKMKKYQKIAPGYTRKPAKNYFSCFIDN